MSDKHKCYQCGRSELVVTEEQPDWVVCGHCGERIMTTQELMASIKTNEEERVKQALGFYDFKPGKD